MGGKNHAEFWWDSAVSHGYVLRVQNLRSEQRNRHDPSPERGGSTTDDVEFSDWSDTIAVIEALGIGRAALVGNSLGGMTAFDTAIWAPERVVAVVGVGAGLGGFDIEPTAEVRALVGA